jgi:hypothetical protein
VRVRVFLERDKEVLGERSFQLGHVNVLSTEGP